MNTIEDVIAYHKEKAEYYEDVARRLAPTNPFRFYYLEWAYCHNKSTLDIQGMLQ